MNRLTYCAAALALVAAPAVGHAAPAPKTVPTTLYMHGPSVVGEVDSVGWLGTATLGESPFTLDSAAPTSADAKSMSYVTVFNDKCTGQPMYPTFQGALAGKIVGDLTLSLHFLSAPATLTAQVWVDTEVYGCEANLGYIPPHAIVTFDVPAGESTVEVKIPRISEKKRTVRKQVIVMIHAPQVPAYEGQVGRIRYDSTATPSSVSFACVPIKGSKRCA